jgi:hypothetical protein
MGTLKPGVGLVYERVDGVVYGRYQGTTDRWEIGRDMRPISPNDIRPEPQTIGWDSAAGHGHNQYTKEEIEALGIKVVEEQVIPEQTNIYKFSEDKLIEEFTDYIDSTYAAHYNTNKIQSMENIIDKGHGTGFCMGNVDKYASRYLNKGTRDDARKDLMKVLHYTLLQLYIHDNNL